MERVRVRVCADHGDGVSGFWFRFGMVWMTWLSE